MEGRNGVEPEEVLRDSFPAIPFMPEGTGDLVFRTRVRTGDQTFVGLAWTQAHADEKAFAAFARYVRERPEAAG